MKTFLLKMLIATLCLVLFSMRFVDATIGESLYEYPLETAWKETGITLEAVSTESWFKVNDRWLSVVELKQLSRRIETHFGVKLRSERLIGEEKDFTYVSFEGIRPDQTVVTVTLQSTKGSAAPETQMGVYTIRNGQIKNLRSYINELEILVNKIGGETNFAVLLEGSYHGKISPVVVKQITGKAFRKLGAELVEAANEGGGSMTKGYTGRLPYVDHTGQRPVNLVISTIYDEERKLTEVVMATPMLAGS